MDFDALAQTWDTKDRMNRAQMIAQEIQKEISDETYHKALEFGCGTGLVSFNLHLVLREMTLVDSSGEMIRIVKNKIRNYALHNMSALQIDIVKGEQLPSSYDLIYSSMALHHISDTKKLLHTLYSHLDKGGRICIVDLTQDDGSFHKSETGFDGHNGFNTGDLANIFEKTGFTNITSKIIYQGIKETEDGGLPYSLFLMTAARKG